MTTSVFVLISSGSAMIGLVVSYWFWVKLRLWRLQCDLLEIRIRLRNTALTSSCLDDPEYRFVVGLINGWISGLTTLSGMAVVYRVVADALADAPPKTTNETLRKALNAERHNIAATWKRAGMAWIPEAVTLRTSPPELISSIPKREVTDLIEQEQTRTEFSLFTSKCRLVAHGS